MAESKTGNSINNRGDNPEEVEATATVTAEAAAAKLSITKTADPTKDVAVGDEITYTVVVTNEITPSVIARLDRLHTKAIVVGRGSKHSHSAHLVKAIKIIGVHNIENVASLLHNGETVVVNGSAGTVKVVA